MSRIAQPTRFSEKSTSKYKKLKKTVFAIFVDFRKVFDSVCRQALFFKLAESKTTGRFYNIKRDMYSNSKGQIKLAGHLSKYFDINKGTEHGHPLSSDLFKHYLGGLISFLEFENCPQLASLIISHLLWADDLIMLSNVLHCTTFVINGVFKLTWKKPK